MEYPTSPSALSSRSAMGDSRSVRTLSQEKHRSWQGLGGWAGAGLMASTLLVICPAAQAETLAAWQFDPATQQLTLTLPSGVTPQYRVERDLARIVLTIPQTQVGSVATQQAYSGAVSQVRLSQVNADTVVELTLAPNTVLTAAGASLVAIAADDQTRWVLTALVATPSTPSLATPSGAPMIVELPVIPSNDPRLGFPEAGTGRLSTSAANLMLPSDVNSLANLPETLPVDPFNLGALGEQVSVPSLAELDAVVGPVATAPQPTPPLPGTIAATPPEPGPVALDSPGPSSTSVITVDPPSLARASTAPTAAPAIAAAPEVAATAPELVSPDPTTAELAPLAPIDSDTTGMPIAVVPPEVASPEPVAPAIAPEPDTVEFAIAPESDAPAPAEPSPGVAAVPAPTIPTVDPAPIASEPPLPPAAESPAPVPQIAAEPLPSPETLPSAAPALNAIVQDPPAIATLPVQVGTDPNLLEVPRAPNTTTQGTVMPPAEPVMLAATNETILFGTPLPSNSLQAAYPNAVDPAPAERPLSPDTLVAAGTILELQYVGNEPLDLNISSTQNQVLLLAHDIRDPMTNGIVAPAGSQLIGQFEPSPQGQRWVSKQLISPSGQQVAFATTTDYLVGSPAVSPPRMAAGAGLGALALLLVTGFSGVGLVGGALIGATTVVGTSPQSIVVEPNQIIQVQVLQDVPRAIPIAAAPEYSREWGIGGW